MGKRMGIVSSDPEELAKELKISKEKAKKLLEKKEEDEGKAPAERFKERERKGLKF